MHAAMSCSSVRVWRTSELSDGAHNLCLRRTDVHLRDPTLRQNTNRRISVVSRANTAYNVVERVLRYPDGHVRRIRYPELSDSHRSNLARDVATVDVQASPQSPQPSSPPSPSCDWYICGELDDCCSFDPGFDLDLPGAAPVEELWGARRDFTSQEGKKDVVSGAAQAPKHDSQPIEEFSTLLSSPAALLKYLSSEKFTSERQNLLDKVARSFEVLHGCPWLYKRQIFTVAVRKDGQEYPSTYTLPVAIDQVGSCWVLLGFVIHTEPREHAAHRHHAETGRSQAAVVQEGSAGEMAQLLNAPHLAEALQMRRMQDGIVAFDCDNAAARFLDALHRAGNLSAALTEVDSHALFRASADAKAAVVLVCGTKGPLVATSGAGEQEGEDDVWPNSAVVEPVSEWPCRAMNHVPEFVPTPAQLAAALRGKASEEQW